MVKSVATGGPAIEVQSLKKTYRDGLLRRRAFEALRGVSFRVEQGEVFGLLGPNGAGKTTFIKIMLGIVRRSGGAAQLLGLPAGDRRSRLRVGYLPEQLRVPWYHNAQTALEYYGRLSGMDHSDIKRRSGELLEQVGLAGRERDAARKYSKGMLQRLGLAQALMHNPDVVFLDEPTDGLDPVGRSDVRSLLRALRDSGKTVFLNSHLLQEVEMVCDRVAILAQGELRGIGTPEDLTASDQMAVTFDLEGDATAIHALLTSHGTVVNRGPLDERRHRFEVRLTDQAKLDACIDHLRSQSVSILGFGRRRATLEEAFINIVGRNKTP